MSSSHTACHMICRTASSRNPCRRARHSVRCCVLRSADRHGGPPCGHRAHSGCRGPHNDCFCGRSTCCPHGLHACNRACRHVSSSCRRGSSFSLRGCNHCLRGSHGCNHDLHDRMCVCRRVCHPFCNRGHPCVRRLCQRKSFPSSPACPNPSRTSSPARSNPVRANHHQMPSSNS